MERRNEKAKAGTEGEEEKPNPAEIEMAIKWESGLHTGIIWFLASHFSEWNTEAGLPGILWCTDRSAVREMISHHININSTQFFGLKMKPTLTRWEERRTGSIVTESWRSSIHPCGSLSNSRTARSGYACSEAHDISFFNCPILNSNSPGYGLSFFVEVNQGIGSHSMFLPEIIQGSLPDLNPLIGPGGWNV